MNFLLDANMPGSTKDILEKYGSVTHAREIGLGMAEDSQIARSALAQNAILITQDLDFGNPHLFPKGTLPGLVIIRPPALASARDINDLTQWLLRSLESDELYGAITVVDTTKIRRREY